MIFPFFNPALTLSLIGFRKLQKKETTKQEDPISKPVI